MDITELTVHELQEKLRNNELKISQIVEAYSNRIEEKEKDVQAFVTILTKEAKEKAKELHLDDAMLARSVNEGFSGGEKKRNEVLQMAILEPKLAILDETDSGLDIDALQVVAAGVNRLRSPERSFHAWRRS